MVVEQRNAHPYHMYDAILVQPEAFAYVIKSNEEAVAAFASRLATHDRVYFTGTGTSYHAAQVGELLMRVYGGRLPAQAMPAFDFALYGPDLSPSDCVITISHRGNKMYSLDSLQRAHAAGCLTAIITGKSEAGAEKQADAWFQTVAQDRSSAHTISYTGTLAVLALLAKDTGAQRGVEDVPSQSFLQKELPLAMRAALSNEKTVAALAQRFANRRRYWIAGGGPSAITAQEIALKIKETSYLQAEGMPVETLMHGPFQAAEAEDLFILIAPEGKAQRRIIELAKQVKAIGAEYIVVSDGTPTEIQADAAGWITVPPVPEPFTALTCLLPLQLFAYYLALQRGTNPDGFRLNDERFAQARGLVRL